MPMSPLRSAPHRSRATTRHALMLVVFATMSIACPNKPPAQSPPMAANKEAPSSDSEDPAKDASAKTSKKAEATWLATIDVGTTPSAEITEALARGEWATARKALAAQKPSASKEPYLMLLLGYAAWKDGDHKACVKTLAPVTKQNTLLNAYAHHWAAECALEAGDWSAATVHAAQVPTSSLHHERALFLLGEALAQAGTTSDRERAEQVYRTYLNTYPRGDDAVEVRMHLAALLEQRKDLDGAAVLYNAVLTHHPLAEEVDAALAKLGELKPKASKETQEAITATSNEQRIRKLRALFRRHRSEQAVEDGARYVEIFEKKSDLYCEALYLTAKSYTKLRRHSDSIAWYERITEDCGDSEYAIKAYYLMGRGHWNSGDTASAKRAFEKVWTRYATHSYADDAMLYVARILRDEGNLGQMRKRLAKQVQRYPDGDMAKDAHWLLVRDMIARKEHAEVITYVDSLEDHGEHNLYSAGRLTYFAGRSHEALKQKEKARERYSKVAREHPLGFYALLSINRLSHLAGVAPSVTNICGKEGKGACDILVRQKTEDVQPSEIAVPDELMQDDTFRRGAALIKLGLSDEAEREFRALSVRYDDETSTLWALAMLLDAAEAYAIAHNIPRRRIDGWQTDYPGDMTRQRWEIAYPAPFDDAVQEWTKKRDVPAQLVWAIMREESGFNPVIESWANARGLMQLMEGTARTVAASDGVSELDAAQLFEAPTNIRLGTAYIAELGEEFDNHPALMIAGYNAGAGNVGRWLDEFGDLPLDLWIEDIPYGQTRHYTKRVLTSFWTYHWLYGDGSTPALSFEVN